MDFNAMNFITNLKYMGIGMLGIFIVMGVIIASVYGLNRLFSGRKENKNNDKAE